MYDYIQGSFAEITPATAIIDIQGVGYILNISLHTYSSINSLKQGKLYTHLIVREDEHTLFGFSTPEERHLFRNLISVSGVGPNTARMVLSSMPPNELVHAILTENVALIKAVKGIGPKTAQRLIIELKDKVTQIQFNDEISKKSPLNNNIYDEALSALLALGFNKNQASEVIKKVLKDKPESTVENVIKLALKFF